MSRFQETFTRSEAEKGLGYDDSAAIFFIGCILFCVIVIWSALYVYDLFFCKLPMSFEDTYKDSVTNCRCSLCNTHHKQNLKQSASWFSKLRGWKHSVQLLVLIALWCVGLRMANFLSTTTQMQSFNPFEILEIPFSATAMEARKAYLRLSRIHHPDRNPNDPTASARFILITKAYTALTDEVARENYAKYGNPDGPGAMKIGIGLPKFLISSHYQLVVLFFFFFTLLLVIPGLFISYFQRQKRYLPTGLRIDSAQLCAYALKEGTRLKALPELLAASAESRELTRLRDSDNEDMKVIYDAVSFPTKKTLCTTPLVLRNYTLLLAHLQNKRHFLSRPLCDDLNVLLQNSELVTQCMVEIAFHRGWLLTFQSVIEFRRRLVQGIDISGLAAPFLQVPHFDESIIRKCIRWHKSLKDLLPLVAEQLKNPASQTFPLSEQQLEDVMSFLKCLPVLRLSAQAYVVDEEVIVEGDMISLEITLIRDNLDNGKTCGLVHAPLFPMLRRETWWLLIYEKASNRLVTFLRTKNLSKSWNEVVQFEAPMKGKWVYQCLALSDDYVGLDVSTSVTVNVLSSLQIERTIYVHPNDEALDISSAAL